MHSGALRKMVTTLATPVRYDLPVGETRLPLNALLGQRLHFKWLETIHCIQCGRLTKKSFQQGHCFPCLRRINECGNCMLHPERCLVEEGQCPKEDWAHIQCHEPHIVYLANSSGLKVGITRHNQVPTRWIDQGAIQALPIVGVQNRRQAGLVEVLFKAHVNDKTNWREMLKHAVTPIDLIAHRDNLFKEAETALATLQARYDAGVIVPMIKSDALSIEYPVLTYPTKITSLSFDKTPEISGVLEGIKGQYLLFDHGVLNIRKFGGYDVEVSHE